MNCNSYDATLLMRDYLAATGDTLSATACQTLGLPYGKHYIHDLRCRLVSLDSPNDVQNGNLSADVPIDSHLSASVALKRIIMKLPDNPFTMEELRHQINLSIGSVSKALRKLENEGDIHRITSTRPCKWRRCPQIRPDFTKVFMEIHGLIDPISSVPLSQITLLANRSLCGMSIDGVNIPRLVTDLTSRYTRISLPPPPLRALEPFLLAVLKGDGDNRAITREFEKALREARTIRRAFERLPRKDWSTSPLEDYSLPTEWFTIFEQLGRISSFIEAVKDSLGAELYPKESDSMTDHAIVKTLEELRNQGIAGRYDPLKKAILDIDPSFHDHALSILLDNISKYVKKADMPIKRVNVKELYLKVALEMVQDKIGDSAGWNKYTTMGSFLVKIKKSMF